MKGFEISKEAISEGAEILYKGSILRPLGKFFTLPLKMRLFILGTFFLMGIIRLAVLVVPFRYFTPLMGEKMAESPADIDPKLLAKAVKVCWVVNKISYFTPWESKCLVCAFTAQLILGLFNIPSTLYLGLAREEKRLLAHAWLRCGRLTITGVGEGRRFTSVAQFATCNKQKSIGI